MPNTKAPKNLFTRDGFKLDLSYITSSVVAMGCPYVASNPYGASSRRGKNDVAELSAMMQRYHGLPHCRVWDFTMGESPLPKYPTAPFGECAVLRRGFSDHTAPPLPLLLSVLSEIAEWLARDPANVAWLHCMAGRGRTGAVASSFLVASGVCTTAKEALATFAQRRGAAVRSGSQRRYVEYVERCFHPLAHQTRSLWWCLPVSPMVLSSVEIFGMTPFRFVPQVELVELGFPHSHLLPKTLDDGSSAKSAVRTSQANVGGDVVTVLQVPVGQRVAGDVLVRVVNKTGGSKGFRLAFHSAFVGPVTRPDCLVVVPREGLDGLHCGMLADRRFGEDLRVVLHFDPAPSTASPADLPHPKL